jgi:phosphoserine phosphatase RsbU/P
MWNCAKNLVATESMPAPCNATCRSRAQGRERLRRLHLHDQLAAAQDESHRELKVVGEIQRSLLPARLPDIPGFDVASYYQPSAHAGGDYYDVVPLAGDNWGLIVADVAGHGASAAVIMAVMRTLVHAHLPTNRYLPACEFLEFMNRQMTGVYLRDGRFVTVWCAVLDPVARTLTYAAAGHNPPRLVRRGNVMSLDAVNGLPIGIEPDSPYREATITLQPGDLLMVYTDGITEASRSRAGVREFFETGRLDRILTECLDGAIDCVNRVTNAVGDFTGQSVPTDDQTMLIIRVNERSAQPSRI